MWSNCATIQISVQVFRIQGNVAEVEVNPGPKAFWNTHLRKALHGLSCCRENIVNHTRIDFVWQSFEKIFDTIMVSDQI